MDYQTRNMVAVKPLRYDRVEIAAGQPFVATVNDARYLTRHGKAAYAPAESEEPSVEQGQAPAAAPAKRAYVRRKPAEAA